MAHIPIGVIIALLVRIAAAQEISSTIEQMQTTSRFAQTDIYAGLVVQHDTARRRYDETVIEWAPVYNAYRQLAEEVDAWAVGWRARQAYMGN